MLRITDISEVVYGGGVQMGEWWDEKRIKGATLKDKEVYKKAGFWVYLGVGIPALLISTFGWWRRQGVEPWAEKLATGFLYDVSRFTRNTVKSLSSPASTTAADQSNAVRQAQEILAAKLRTANEVRELASGAGNLVTNYALSQKDTIMV